MGDYVELLIFLAVVFFSLLAGSKKKKRASRPPQQLPRRPAGRPAVRRQPRPAPSPPARAQARPPPAPPPERGAVAEELFDLLTGRVPMPPKGVLPTPQPPEAKEAVSLERITEEAASLETLKPAGGESHRRFHERYVDAPPPPSQPVRPVPRWRRITPNTAKEAVIWRTIFSPPKGLDL